MKQHSHSPTVALVTGAASGIGLALAARLLAWGQRRAAERRRLSADHPHEPYTL